MRPKVRMLAAILAMASASVCAQTAGATRKADPRFTYDHGGIVRGDRGQKQIALIFTGGDFADGTASILDTLKKEKVPASVFVTGGFLRNAANAKLLRRAVQEGHYVGPHSDQHLLYAKWEQRDKSIVSAEEFKQDLKKNIGDLKELGALTTTPVYFIPPFEWFNEDQVRWSEEMGVELFNYSPGSGSNRDYLPESDKRFVSSRKILDDILGFEEKSSDGLNGYLLLLHLGADRKDAMYALLPELIEKLRARGYKFVRIDKMLGEK